jgi:hypothetical protein
VEVVVDPRLESLQNHAVGTFYLPIRHGVSHGGPVHPDVVILAEVQELSAGELGVVVGDDGVRDPEVMDDVGEECDRLFGPCWELVLKCYELRTRQHKVLNVNVLRP